MWKILTSVVCVCAGQLHMFAANMEHPTINNYSEEIEFASVVCKELENIT